MKPYQFFASLAALVVTVLVIFAITHLLIAVHPLATASGAPTTVQPHALLN